MRLGWGSVRSLFLQASSTISPIFANSFRNLIVMMDFFIPIVCNVTSDNFLFSFARPRIMAWHCVSPGLTSLSDFCHSCTFAMPCSTKLTIFVPLAFSSSYWAIKKVFHVFFFISSRYWPSRDWDVEKELWYFHCRGYRACKSGSLAHCRKQERPIWGVLFISNSVVIILLAKDTRSNVSSAWCNDEKQSQLHRRIVKVPFAPWVHIQFQTTQVWSKRRRSPRGVFPHIHLFLLVYCFLSQSPWWVHISNFQGLLRSCLWGLFLNNHDFLSVGECGKKKETQAWGQGWEEETCIEFSAHSRSAECKEESRRREEA